MQVYRERVKANPGNYEEYLYRDRERWRARQDKIKKSERATIKKPAQEMAGGCKTLTGELKRAETCVGR